MIVKLFLYCHSNVNFILGIRSDCMHAYGVRFKHEENMKKSNGKLNKNTVKLIFML